MRPHVERQRDDDLREGEQQQPLDEHEPHEPPVAQRRAQPFSGADGPRARRGRGTRLRHAHEHDGAVAERRDRVDHEEQHEVAIGEHASERRRAREPEVDGPVQKTVGARAISRRHDVGHRRLVRGPTQVREKTEQRRERDDGQGRTREAEREHERARHRRAREQRRAPADAIGERAAHGPRAEPARRVEADDEPRDVGPQTAGARQVDAQEKEDGATQAVEQHPAPQHPVRARQTERAELVDERRAPRVVGGRDARTQLDPDRGRVRCAVGQVALAHCDLRGRPKTESHRGTRGLRPGSSRFNVQPRRTQPRSPLRATQHIGTER